MAIYKMGIARMVRANFLMGAFFIGGQVYEYAKLVSEGISLSAQAYGSVFYITTGFHGMHVTGGLIAFLVVLLRVFKVQNLAINKLPPQLWFLIIGTSSTSFGSRSSRRST